MQKPLDIVKQTNASFAQNWDEFKSTLHLHTTEFKGIGAAAHYLGGDKISIPENYQFNPQDMHLVENLAYENYIVHGMSKGIFEFVKKTIRFNPKAKLLLVWHGNLTQLSHDDELELFNLFIHVSKLNQVEKVAFIRFDNFTGIKKQFEGPLLNAPPKIFRNNNRMNIDNLNDIKALLPSWQNIRKNLAFNISAAVGSESIGLIEHYANLGLVPKLFPNAKLRQIKYLSDTKHLNSLAKYNVVLNVTTIDCQPIVDLETLASGTKLLGAKHAPIESILDHQIWSLIKVENPFDVLRASKKLRELVAIDELSWGKIVEDFIPKYELLCRESWTIFTQ
jgi:hypothetical protein